MAEEFRIPCLMLVLCLSFSVLTRSLCLLTGCLLKCSTTDIESIVDSRNQPSNDVGGYFWTELLCWTIAGITFFAPWSFILIRYVYCFRRRATHNSSRNVNTERLVLDQNGRLPIYVRPRVHHRSHDRISIRAGLFLSNKKRQSKPAQLKPPPPNDAEGVAPPPYEESMSMIECSRSEAENGQPLYDHKY